MLEGAHNQSLQKHIRDRCRLFTYKTADRHIAGVPDIYIPGGIWIECKVIRCSRGVDWVSKITNQQHAFLNHLERGGDYTLCAARFETPQGTYRGVIVPHAFLYRRPRVWTVNDAECCDRWRTIDDILNAKFPRNINQDWYEEFLS